MTTFLFPGQGSQKKGMGDSLFEAYPKQVAIADQVLGYSIQTLCLEDPQNQLNQTQYTQPALFVVNALSFLKENQTPQYVAGHSLGEYNALLAAGAFDFETGLKLVQKRSQLMAQAQLGGMAAVIGMTSSQIQETLEKHGLKQIDIANFNAPDQIVISGDKTEIEQAKAPFEAAGARMFIPLKVSGAFHSRLMTPAQQEFQLFLENFTFNKLKIPVISNVTARPYSKEQIAKLLSDQLNSSVQWIDSIRYLMGKGETEFVEVGPGKTLTGMVKKILNSCTPLIPTPAEENPSQSKEARWSVCPPESASVQIS